MLNNFAGLIPMWGTQQYLLNSQVQTVTNKTFSSSNTYNGGTFNSPTIATPTVSSPVFSGTPKIGTYNLPKTIYTSFDIEEAVMDADGGTGIHVASVEIATNAIILGAYARVTQGCGDAADTLEMAISSTTAIGGVVKTLVAAQDCSAASSLIYVPASSTSVAMGLMSSTNKYLGLWYKDVGNDGSTAANLQGTLHVVYLEI